ncbi:MAG TPA: ParB/RepB/Spo0J family partition protein [Thermoanaerobaculaceae bacterium]|nr:ParB/RepB/Spo0J family partition protein [Thermoanaerobaculaceae bacterium]HQU43520.1 ParB/RepB/Spo0J family partition protein [Pirellulales bacterium]
MMIVELNLSALDVRYGGLRVRYRRREAQLMASLEEHGQQDAICVIDAGEGRFAVVDGHKRVRALRRLRRDTVKAVVWEMPASQALAAAYRAASREGYNAIEEGWLVCELHRVGKLDLGKTAAAMGRSKSWASRRLGLVEGLPDGVLESVRRGELGAWSAMKHLLPLARANAAACESLAGKIVETGMSSRQVTLVCGHFAKSGAEVRERILEDPARFLKALEASSKGPQDGALSEAENRAHKQLELVGNVALGLTRWLPPVLGYDAGEIARAKLWSAWDRAAKRLALLDETVSALKAAREKNREERHAQSGDADGGLDAAQAGSRQPQDREGLGIGAQRGAGGDRQRPCGGGSPGRAAAPVGAIR